MTRISVSVSAEEVLKQLQPEIEAEVRARLAARDAMLAHRRSELQALETAIDTVVAAVGRVDNSHHSRDESRAIQALVAAASGLRRASYMLKKGK